jgi:hypothetical protein
MLVVVSLMMNKNQVTTLYEALFVSKKNEKRKKNE